MKDARLAMTNAKTNACSMKNAVKRRISGPFVTNWSGYVQIQKAGVPRARPGCSVSKNSVAVNTRNRMKPVKFIFRLAPAWVTRLLKSKISARDLQIKC